MHNRFVGKNTQTANLSGDGNAYALLHLVTVWFMSCAQHLGECVEVCFWAAEKWMQMRGWLCTLRLSGDALKVIKTASVTN